jgi:hypothetical protein
LSPLLNKPFRLKLIKDEDDIEAEVDNNQSTEESSAARSDPHMNTPKTFASPSPADAEKMKDSGLSSPKNSSPISANGERKSPEASKDEGSTKKVVDVALNVGTQEATDDVVEENGEIILYEYSAMKRNLTYLNRCYTSTIWTACHSRATARFDIFA